MKNKQYKAAIFDMDGTLTDSMYIWDTAGISYLKSRGKNPAPNLRDQLRPLSLHQAARLFQSEYGVTETVTEILQGLDQIVETEYRTNVILKPGAYDLLQSLKGQGLKLSVATSSPRGIVLEVLDRLEILPCFHHVLTCGEIGKGKDHPDIYDQSAARMGSSRSDTLVFEDALHAVTTASRAGYYVVGIYDESEGTNEDQIMPLCSQYIRQLSDFIMPGL